jgi:acyl-CoA thioesterase YciA
MPVVVDQLPDGEPALKIPARPQDVNIFGDIFGGWLMSQVDIAGAMCAIDRSRGRVATRAVSNFQFLRPVKVADLVLLYAEVVKVGNTSVTVDVAVYIERHQQPTYDVIVQKVAEARLVYVAVNEDGTPRMVLPQ